MPLPVPQLSLSLTANSPFQSSEAFAMLCSVSGEQHLLHGKSFHSDVVRRLVEQPVKRTPATLGKLRRAGSCSTGGGS